MGITNNENFHNQITPSIAADEYRGCNFSHPSPAVNGAVVTGVRIFPDDDTPRSFRDCNLVNCEPPPGSTVDDCNTALIEYGIDIGGVLYNRLYGRGGMVDGVWTYKYLPEPIDMEVD